MKTKRDMLLNLLAGAYRTVIDVSLEIEHLDSSADQEDVFSDLRDLRDEIISILEDYGQGS